MFIKKKHKNITYKNISFSKFIHFYLGVIEKRKNRVIQNMQDYFF